MNSAEIDIHKELKKYFGFSQFKGLQEQVIKSIITGNNTFVIMPTGGGKSLCYQLPALIHEGTAIVVSPLIALMKNQVDAIRSLSSENGIAHVLNSSLNKTEIAQVKKDITSGITKLLYVAPESLTKEEYVAFLQSVPISFVAIDEAHCISEWGHDFRPEYRRLKEMMEEINPSAPIIALTATATPKVQSDIVKNLSLNNPEILISSFNRENLYYEVQPKIKKDQTVKSIVKYITKHKKKSGIIYTLNRKTTEELADLLKANNIKAVAYHAGLDQKLRAERQDQFLNEDVQVIVATIAFGMGIDKPDIRFVIHYNIPKSIENYYQETGRAGRDGLEGNCILYYSQKDVSKLEHFLRDKPLSEREVGAQLIDETVAFAESGVCRRRSLLHYFGESWPDKNCGKCDNCLHPKEQFQAKTEIVQLLQTIQALDERFVAAYVVQIITGHYTPQIGLYRHEKLPVFGIGKTHDDLFWNSLIRQAMLEELIEKDIEEYGLLKLTSKGQKFLKKPSSFLVVLQNVFAAELGDDEESEVAEDAVTTDDRLFELLKDLRQVVAKKIGLPPFVIFLETSLQDMATLYPTSFTELERCQGVSKGKSLKYGEAFIKLIEQYVIDHNIEKPEDFVMKSVANKSSNKIYIIQNVDKKIPLETIAKNKDLRLDSLLEEMETIAASGTKLNLDYAIDEWLDEYDQEEILEYFKSCETSSLQIAQQELSENEYTWEQLKIMRIKFLSVVGN